MFWLTTGSRAAATCWLFVSGNATIAMSDHSGSRKCRTICFVYCWWVTYWMQLHSCNYTFYYCLSASASILRLSLVPWFSCLSVYSSSNTVNMVCHQSEMICDHPQNGPRDDSVLHLDFWVSLEDNINTAEVSLTHVSKAACVMEYAGCLGQPESWPVDTYAVSHNGHYRGLLPVLTLGQTQRDVYLESCRKLTQPRFPELLQWGWSSKVAPPIESQRPHLWEISQQSRSQKKLFEWASSFFLSAH